MTNPSLIEMAREVVALKEPFSEEYPFYRHQQRKLRNASVAPALATALLRAEEELRLILPMALGYAAEHPVGSNQEYAESARAFLAALSEPKP